MPAPFRSHLGVVTQVAPATQLAVTARSLRGCFCNQLRQINKLGELVDTGEKLGLVEKSGTWYSYAGTKIGQGRDKVLAHLDEHPALQAQLREQLIKQARLASINTANANGLVGNPHTASAVAAGMNGAAA